MQGAALLAACLAALAPGGHKRGAALLAVSGQRGTLVPFSKHTETPFITGVKGCLLSPLSQGLRHRSVCTVAEAGGRRST